jgi:type IX secretion system PorP/SprF family membrane protein
MKSFWLYLFIIGSSCSLIAQQEPQFSHNMFNNMGINPGFAGLRNSICATGLFRQQWSGFNTEEGEKLSPESYVLNVDAPISFLKGGLALGFMQDNVGFQTTVGVKLGYSYHYLLGYGKLGIGGQIGFLDTRIDFSQFTPITEGDPVLAQKDEQSNILLDFALGGFYKSDENVWLGISVSQLRQASSEIGFANYQNKRHYYAAGGFDYFYPGNSNYVITPSALIKTDFNSMQIDINALVTYQDKVWGGVSYRIDDAIVFLLGVKLNQISVGYSYDLTTSLLGRQGRSWGSHEIMLQYCFNLEIERLNQPFKNVRFL